MKDQPMKKSPLFGAHDMSLYSAVTRSVDTLNLGFIAVPVLHAESLRSLSCQYTTYPAMQSNLR